MGWAIQAAGHSNRGGGIRESDPERNALAAAPDPISIPIHLDMTIINSTRFIAGTVVIRGAGIRQYEIELHRVSIVRTVL